MVNENRELQEDNIEEENIEDAQKVISQIGDMWLLGEHRLLYGDSTKLDHVQKLMDGRIADMVFTDPPYNLESNRLVRADILRHEDFVEGAGEMSEEEFITFLNTVFKNLTSVSKDGSIHFICMDWRHIWEVMEAARQNYSEHKQLCVWKKNNMGLGSFYRSQHELIFVFKHGSMPHTNNIRPQESGRVRTNVWEYASMNSYGADDRTELSALHPTVKPLQLVADAILDCSNYGDLILDLFGGSGTTLIACEEMNRKCYMMELDPKYVDTIIRRWQTRTGKQAIHTDSGRTFDEIFNEKVAC